MAIKTSNETKKVINLEPNLAAALCYAPFVGWVAAIVLLVLEKDKEVKWHAIQALMLAIAIMIVASLLSATFVLVVLSPIVWVGGMVLQLILVVKTYQKEKYRLPVLAEWTDKVVAGSPAVKS